MNIKFVEKKSERFRFRRIRIANTSSASGASRWRARRITLLWTKEVPLDNNNNSEGEIIMFASILNMVLGLIVGSVKSASHITQDEWTILESVQTAIGELLAKKPATMT